MEKTENSFLVKCKEDKKRVMIIVPHEDDEINVAAGILANYARGAAEIMVVFTTNGDCFEPAMVRQKEAVRSVKCLGGDGAKVIFLGYPDQLNMAQETWIDKKGRTQTYGTKDFPDYRYVKDGSHSRFCHESLVKDIKDVILDFLPDELFCVDFDSHSDHRAASLAFEAAMGEILKERISYAPLVYKGFAYPTAFKGERDFHDRNNSTKFVKEAFSAYDMQNPYYKWEQRVRFPIVDKVRKRLLMQNVAFKALAKHKSQIIISQAESIINDDQVFWQRRTDNLLRYADVKASSGNGAFLNDFIMYDNTNIMGGNKEHPKFDKRIWIPEEDDGEKSVRITFKGKVNVKKMVFYMGCNTVERVQKARMQFDNGYEHTIVFDKENVQEIEIPLQQDVQWINIRILATGKGAGFTEIEVFSEEREEVRFLKLTEKDAFCYETNSLENKSIYIYDGYIGKSIPISDGVTIKEEKLKGQKWYRMEWKNNPEVYDIVRCIKRERKKGSIGIRVVNRLTYVLTYCWYRILRKLRNSLKKPE